MGFITGSSWFIGFIRRLCISFVHSAAALHRAGTPGGLGLRLWGLRLGVRGGHVPFSKEFRSCLANFSGSGTQGE